MTLVLQTTPNARPAARTRVVVVVVVVVVGPRRDQPPLT